MPGGRVDEGGFAFRTLLEVLSVVVGSRRVWRTLCLSPVVSILTLRFLRPKLNRDSPQRNRTPVWKRATNEIS